MNVSPKILVGRVWFQLPVELQDGSIERPEALIALKLPDKSIRACIPNLHRGSKPCLVEILAALNEVVDVHATGIELGRIDTASFSFNTVSDDSAQNEFIRHLGNGIGELDVLFRRPRTDATNLFRLMFAKPMSVEAAHDAIEIAIVRNEREVAESAKRSKQDRQPLPTSSRSTSKRRIQTDPNRIKILCENGLIESSVFEREDGAISRRLLDAERVDQIASDLDRVVHHWEFWKAFRLPSYAVEQLICLNVIEGLTDPAIVTLRNEAMVPRSELDRLAQRLRGCARKGSPSSSVKSLRVLSHEIGGRLKPWGYIWKALLDGDLPFWTKSVGRSTQHILFEPLSWEEFSKKSFDKNAFPDFPFKTFMNNCDLSEVLNLQPRETIAIRRAKLIEPRAYKLTLRYKVEDVLDLAVRYVSATELMRRSKQVKKVVLRKLSEENVKAQSCLSERATAEADSMPASILRV